MLPSRIVRVLPGQRPSAQWANDLKQAVQEGTPISSPEIRIERTTQGTKFYLSKKPAISKPTVFVCRYQLSLGSIDADSSSESADSTDGNKEAIHIGPGSRRTIAEDWINDNYVEDFELPVDGLFTNETALVYMSYQYGAGWDMGPFFIDRPADMPVEGVDRHVPVLGEVSFNSDGKVTSIVQRSFGDIEFYNATGCPSP